MATISSAQSTTSSTNPILTPAPSTISTNSFAFPSYAQFPPFYTLQPNLTIRARQIELWTLLLKTYCQHHHIFRLSLSSPPADLFANASLNRALNPTDLNTLLETLAQPDRGPVIEWIAGAKKSDLSQACYVWWRSAQEWADLMYAWVEETGQKGTVLTLYELRESDAVRGKEWKEMDEGMVRRVLSVLVKRGKAQVFGQEAGEGVKFF